MTKLRRKASIRSVPTPPFDYIEDRKAFAIQVSGISMEPNLRDGDIVICSPTQTIANGVAAVIQTRSNQVLIKYWNRIKDRVILENAHPDYKPIEFPVAEITNVWPIVQRICSGKIQKQT